MASTIRQLRAAASLESYLANPIGSYIAGPNAAAFWATATVSGMSFWGRPTDGDSALIAKAVRSDTAPWGCCHTAVVDVRNLQFLDLHVFDRLFLELNPHFRALGTLVTRRAVIVPPGPTGTLVAEFFRSLTGDASARSFPDPIEALVWIQAADSTLLADLDQFPRSDHAPILAGLRELLDKRSATRADEAARRLGMSQRTFQRRLREQGTSFQKEVNEARLRTAKELMVRTTHPLKWIAVESGYASLQHFSSVFRAQVGEAPTRWRSTQAWRRPDSRTPPAAPV